MTLTTQAVRYYRTDTKKPLSLLTHVVLGFCRCHPPIVVIVILLNRLFRSDSVVPVFNSKTLFTDHNPVTASSTVLKIKAKFHGFIV